MHFNTRDLSTSVNFSTASITFSRGSSDFPTSDEGDEHDDEDEGDGVSLVTTVSSTGRSVVSILETAISEGG